MWEQALQVADELADRLRQLTGADKGVPVPVDDIAARFGIYVDRNAQIRQDGRLSSHNGQSVILVQAGQEHVRARFTLAHELGHWAVNHRRDPVATAARALFISEETMCNVVAGALLLPKGWLEATFPEARDPDRHRLDLLVDIARGAQASYAATAVRLVHVFGWRKTLLSFARRREAWLFDGEAAVLPWEQGFAIPGTWAGHQVNEVWLCGAPCGDGGYAGTKLLPMESHAYDGEARAEIRTWRDHAIALIPAPFSAPRPTTHPHWRPDRSSGYVAQGAASRALVSPDTKSWAV
jgi:Zn-dependent peptidase ImmA (M78 family)